MEFKYMLIGEEFYGDEAAFNQMRPEQGEDERDAFVRRQTMHSSTENGSATEADWKDKKFNNLMVGQGDFDIGRKLDSKNKQQ